ncbi:hypothetical protein IIB49_03195 [Patescibacteria group bacterium]|nr:hypothetical protein [Patescibacteria group bacterium]
MEKVITIPKELAKKGDLVIIPRKEYEGLVLRQKIVPVVKMTSAQKRDLKEARKEFARGEYVTLEQLENELGITFQKKLFLSFA